MSESRVKQYFEDCRVGDKVVTPGRTITEADLIVFSAYTGDWLPQHSNAEYAKRTPFGERIAHGMLVLSVGSALLLRLGEAALLPQSTIALYEIQRVRFRLPTKLGDTLRLTAEIRAMTELNRSRGLIVLGGLIQNQYDETVASWSMKALVGRRPRIAGTGRCARG
jgi:3-hydroxybutyryl-CoA dehydratase